jgi:hypothetical protein
MPVSTSTVVFIAGALFILITVVGGDLKIKEVKIPPILMAERIGLGVVGTFFILCGILLSTLVGSEVGAGSKIPAASPASATQQPSDPSRPGVPPGTAQPRVTFTTPSENGFVAWHPEVRGVVVNISPDWYLWLVVRSEEPKLYLQN